MNETRKNPEEAKVSAIPHIPKPPEREIIYQGTFKGFGTWALDKDGLLTIDGEGRMPDWGYFGNMAPWMTFNIQSVRLASGITSIGDGAFWDCRNLTDIAIPDGVTSIGYEVFSGCSSLTDIVIPGSVTSISDSAFEGCSSLTSVTMPRRFKSYLQGDFHEYFGISPRIVTFI